MSDQKKKVNITPGVCGDNSHYYVLQGQEEGMAEIDNVTYYWFGGCPICIKQKLEQLRAKAEA